MDPDGAPQQTTLLEGLGLFKIWATIILGPVLIIGLIVVMVVVGRLQKDWTLSTATATKEVLNCPHATDANDQQWSCDVPVSVAGLPTLPSDFTLEVDVPTNQVEKGAQFKVIYDPNNPEKTLTTGIITSAGRSGVEVILGVVLALAVLFFVLNLIFRRNRTWQNVQGVFQGVDLAHGLLQR